MARPIPPDRFRQLVEAATSTFIARGYRLTQMADVAQAMGLAKGTLYGYVESKEALFDAAVRYADGHTPLPSLADLPLPSPQPGATVAHVQERLTTEAQDMILLRLATGALSFVSPREELEAVLSDLYRRIARNRLAIKLVDRCAKDYPELAAVWFGSGRWAQHQLLVQLLEQGRYRPVPSPEIVARTVLETVAFWAMHRHFDASPQPVSDEDAERSLLDFVCHALLLPEVP
jgi:AcrR family transcriptional regulator